MRKLIYSILFLLAVAAVVLIVFKMKEKKVDTKAQEESASDTASVRFDELNESFEDIDFGEEHDTDEQ